jgi:hypothetical protein
MKLMPSRSSVCWIFIIVEKLPWTMPLGDFCHPDLTSFSDLASLRLLPQPNPNSPTRIVVKEEDSDLFKC